MVAFLIFMFPVIFCGVGAIFAAQMALEFNDTVRDMLVVLLMAAAIVLEDKLGPSSVERR